MENEYLALLKEKRNLAQGLWRGTVNLTNAVEKEDYGSIKKLLIERQGQMDQLVKLVGNYQKEVQCPENEETLRIKRDVKSLLEQTVTQSRQTLENIIRQKDTAAHKIRCLQLSKKAMSEGYFKKIPQSYGYFIDKKIGALHLKERKR
ncbi:hypothetical protein [Desulfosporosinus hippei]|uniref:FlgN protein n=1 Tax=Desulfosporosinus hippei DSM 8344 TaxID=1121419 RepID=A0A1G8CYV7_9FIRM|nr:hypothetical protein [Desulfosporosinus hippei]SDH50685.1 hypothetical protein SAMN05443529_11465 [Desulfosporosinus hippei DSM 8344]